MIVKFADREEDLPMDKQTSVGPAELRRRLGEISDLNAAEATLMITFSLGGVRFTTRIDENRLEEGLFSTFHECGHAL